MPFTTTITDAEILVGATSSAHRPQHGQCGKYNLAGLHRDLHHAFYEAINHAATACSTDARHRFPHVKQMFTDAYAAW